MILEYTIKSNNKNKDYSVVLFFDEGKIIPEKCSCTCRWGSFYRFTKENIASGKWQCKHLIKAIEMFKNKEPDNIEKEKGGNDGKRNSKPLYPIFQ